MFLLRILLAWSLALAAAPTNVQPARGQGGGPAAVPQPSRQRQRGRADIATARGPARLDLNGEWRFRTDAAKRGEAQDWPERPPADTEAVRVPHTWNVGKYEDYEGVA
jgi:hypothetical protein